MSALVKNDDLVPDAAGMITKQQTFDALVNTGISRKAAKETTDANFDHLDDKQLNVFRMNTVKPPGRGTPDPPGPLEHFRSTGIRDELRPNAGKYAHFHSCARFDGDADTFSSRDIRECANMVWDRDPGGLVDFSSLPAKLPSNDVLESKRPSTCGPTDSGPELCPSQLHGAINFLHEEFGTPTGESALMPVADMRRLWLKGEYPAGFLARSPRSCLNAIDSTAAGCQRCLDEVPSTGPGGLPVTAATSTEAQRYCRCLASRNLTMHQLDAIPAHGDLQCPRDPVIEAIITVAPVASRQRALQQGTGQETYADALRGTLRGFYASIRPHLRVLEYKEADVLIRPLREEGTEVTYEVSLAATKEDAPYLAHSVHVALLNYVPETTTTVRVVAVTVHDDIRLESDCGQFCEASGSFLRGFIPQKPPPPPAPPTAPGARDDKCGDLNDQHPKKCKKVKKNCEKTKGRCKHQCKKEKFKKHCKKTCCNLSKPEPPPPPPTPSASPRSSPLSAPTPSTSSPEGGGGLGGGNGGGEGGGDDGGAVGGEGGGTEGGGVPPAEGAAVVTSDVTSTTTGHADFTYELIVGGVASVALLALLVLASRCNLGIMPALGLTSLPPLCKPCFNPKAPHFGLLPQPSPNP